MKLITLEEGETMSGRNRAERLVIDCSAIASLIDNQPGIGSKTAIAEATGFSCGHVARCLDHINSNKTPFSRVDYGIHTARSGPYAGQTVQGWWPSRVAAYAPVMDLADEHSASVERGVRRSRLERRAFAQGLGTRRAAEVVTAIEERLGTQIEWLSVTDLDAFEELVAEELEA